MNRNNFDIDFEVSGEGELFFAECGERRVMQCIFQNGVLDFELTYDFKEDRPLHVRARVGLGSRIKIHILPYRMELYVDGVLADEEWPCGTHYLAEASITENNCRLCMHEGTAEDKSAVPSVLGSFQNAEGWQPEESVFVGDCMPYCHDGVYHVLYLKDRHRHQSKWGLGAHQWSHISTEDFVNWAIHPMAVEIDDPKEGSICTGSWISEEDRQYLFYTVRMCDRSPAAICRSVSEDGFHFEKDRSFAFALSEKYTAFSARDPKVIKDSSGIYHMFLTTTVRKSGRGCLAHLTSQNLNDWQECDEPIYIAPENMGEPECPDYFYKDGFYYLVYSLKGKGYYQYSEHPFEGWKMPEHPVIPCKSVPEAAVWKDRLIFTGFEGNGLYAGTMTFLEAMVGKDGQLSYKAFEMIPKGEATTNDKVTKDKMTMREKMHTCELYYPNDEEIVKEQTLCMEKLYDYNGTRPLEGEKRTKLLKEMFAEIGEGCYIEPPLHANWGGRHVHFGKNVYANFNLTMVDDTHIYVGDYTMFGPNVTIATAGHPLNPELREQCYQYNASVHIGKNCWIGAGAIILPGITIGDNVVVGAGSVVTKDLPDNVLAVGNPCKVLRELNDHDKEYYFKDKKIDYSSL